MEGQKSKYIVPDQIKDKVRNFLDNFLKANKITKTELARTLETKLGRSGCRVNLVKKFSRASFQFSEVMEILDLYGYELKIIPKTPIEHLENLENTGK